MGVIPNPKIAFIFPISCILALIFPIFIKYFPKCKGKGSFPKSQIKSLAHVFCYFSATKSKESADVPPAEGEMSVLVTIDKPEIILIEDQSNFSSNALILDVSFTSIGICGLDLSKWESQKAILEKLQSHIEI